MLFSGESGLGKSTLLNSLFLTDLYTAAKFPTTEEKLAKTTEVIFPFNIGNPTVKYRLQLKLCLLYVNL